MATITVNGSGEAISMEMPLASSSLSQRTYEVKPQILW
jgi:hypothetical protein